MNRELEEKARALPGIKVYVTNLAACPDGTPVTPEPDNPTNEPPETLERFSIDPQWPGPGGLPATFPVRSGL